MMKDYSNYTTPVVVRDQPELRTMYMVTYLKKGQKVPSRDQVITVEEMKKRGLPDQNELMADRSF